MSLDTPLSGAADWTPAGPLTPITEAEQYRRAVLEQRITAGLDAFMDVGTALVEMRDSRLYRSTHPTFAAYCADELGMSRTSAYELMEAAEVVSGIPDTAPRPSNVGQARALAAAPEAERADVMAAVAAQGKPTAAAIAAEVEARHPKPAGAQPPPPVGRAPASPPAPSPGPYPVETEQEPTVALSDLPLATADEDRCNQCGDDGPGVSGGWCVDCWENAPPEPQPKAEDDPTMQRLKLRAAVAASRQRALALFAEFPPELVASQIDGDEWDEWQRRRRSIDDWFDRLDALRPAPGLRLMGGAP